MSGQRYTSDEPVPIASRVLLKVTDAAALLSVSRATAYRLCQRGELQTVRVGGQWRVPRAALDAYAARLVAQAHAEDQTVRTLLVRVGNTR